MTYGNGYYPPGTPGPHSATVETWCRNDECEAYKDVVEFTAFWELGGTFLHPASEEDRFDQGCPSCGAQFTDDTAVEALEFPSVGIVLLDKQDEIRDYRSRFPEGREGDTLWRARVKVEEDLQRLRWKIADDERLAQSKALAEAAEAT